MDSRQNPAVQIITCCHGSGPRPSGCPGAQAPRRCPHSRNQWPTGTTPAETSAAASSAHRADCSPPAAPDAVATTRPAWSTMTAAQAALDSNGCSRPWTSPSRHLPWHGLQPARGILGRAVRGTRCHSQRFPMLALPHASEPVQCAATAWGMVPPCSTVRRAPDRSGALSLQSSHRVVSRSAHWISPMSASRHANTRRCATHHAACRKRSARPHAVRSGGGVTRSTCGCTHAPHWPRPTLGHKREPVRGRRASKRQPTDRREPRAPHQPIIPDALGVHVARQHRHRGHAAFWECAMHTTLGVQAPA